MGLAIMLRTYFLQQWFGLSDPGMEEAFYESAVLQRFAGVDLGVAAAPDETTILRFRHLLEQHDLCGEMLDTVNRYPVSYTHLGADLKELVMIRVFQSFPQKKRFFCFRISRVLPGATAIMMLAILSQIDESVIHSEHWA